MKVFLFLLLLASCSHKPQKNYPKLFPFGTYKHYVEIKLKDGKLSFQGINRSTSEGLLLIALGGFDVTVLQYKEEYASNKKEIYFDKNMIPMSEEKLLLYLSAFKDIYALDKSICEKNLCHKSFYGRDLFFDLNAAGEVSAIRFAQGESKVKISVVGYEKVN